MHVQGLNSGFQSAIMVISPIVSAFLLANFSLSLIFSIDILTAVLGILTLLILVNQSLSVQFRNILLRCVI